MEDEITRLRNEVRAKDETLNQLKLKTKSFVDNLRQELAVEKKKVVGLEDQLQQAKQNDSSGDRGSSEEAERLKREIATLSQHGNEFKARAKQFADSMKAQLQVEKDKATRLEKELHDKDASHDLLEGNDAKHKDDAIATLTVQLQTSQQEITTARSQLREADEKMRDHAQELVQVKQALDALKESSEEQIARLQSEVSKVRTHEHDLEATQKTANDAFVQEHGQLEAAQQRCQELADQLQQYKIENVHLQKKLQDKDFLLEQMEAYRVRADESEGKVNTLRGEIAALNSQIASSDEQMGQACVKCDDLQRELSEMTTLYEKVNMGRSQSDSQLCEAQAALKALQGVKQSYEAAQTRLEEVANQNMQLNEKIFQKQSEVDAFKSDVQRLTAEVAQLNQLMNASKSDSFTRKQQAHVLEAEKKQADKALREALAKTSALEKTNLELAATVEAVTKDSNEKRQKAKALVISLTNEKQSAADAKADLQKEVDRLRMELNQKNVENERRLKQLQEENQQRLAQTASTSQSLNDEISTLKQALALVQESERSQQRAKELATARREVEDSNKKRLAAKAETQKLAVELETVQKSMSQLVDSASTTCTSSVKKMNHLEDRVNEALQVLEKRASAAGKKLNSTSSTSQNVEVEDLRVPESTRPLSPSSGARKVEENIARVTDKLALLVEVTEKLCDFSIEQNDVNLKDVVVDKFSQLFTQCFSEKLRAAYSKVEDAAENGGLIGAKS